MKNKILLAVMMLFLVGICCVPTNTYAGICDMKGHSLSSATCTSAPVCSVCGATVGSAKGHSYGGYSVTTWETCTTSGYEKAYCSCGASTGRSRDALGHDMDSWYDNGASNHKRKCTRCSYSETESHNNDIKTSLNLDTEHQTNCSVCNRRMPNEAHPGWTVGGEEPTVHSCPQCKDEVNEEAKKYHRYPGLSSGYIGAPTYSCDLCGITLTILNGTYPSLHATGLPESKYVASDASIAMATVPTFPHGTYTLYWTNGDSSSPKLRDGGGNIVTPQVNPADVAIFSWSRKNLKTHAQKTKDYAKSAYEAQIDLYGVAFFGNEVIGSSVEDLYKTYDLIDSDINRASSNEKLNWNGVL